MSDLRNSAGVADHKGVAGVQAETPFEQDSRIHAGENRQPPPRPHRQISQVEVLHKFFVGFQQFIGD